MSFSDTLETLLAGNNLSREQTVAVMRQIMGGEATPAQVAGFLIALRAKGETVDEIAGGAQVMRELAAPVTLPDDMQAMLVDTCGTGGDASGLFNVSTASAFVVAAAGGRVAKHGNRSVSSKSGSADVLEAAGVALNLSPEAVAQCVQELGVGFMFAPNHHAAMKHAIGPRRELGVRTIFNLLGPLTNPAGAPNQVLGVFDGKWCEPLAEVLGAMGSRHVVVVASHDGLDEISPVALTKVVEYKQGKFLRHTVDPAEFDMNHNSLAPVQVADAAASLALIEQALDGNKGQAYDTIALNAGAAIYAADLADTFAGGVRRAFEVLDSGDALVRMHKLAALSQTLAP